MNRLILLTVFLGLGLNLSAQVKLKKQLDSINTTEKAKQFLKEHKKRNGKILTFNEEKHKTPFAEEILQMGHGGTKVFKNEYENIHYKVLDKKKIPYYRVNYIMLDGRKMSQSDIDNVRPHLIAEINKGTPFKDLARQFSMDQNANRGGDSGWITYGDMLPEFEQQVMNDAHVVNDVFTVDVESNQWYYVVQKAYDKKDITEVKVLRLVVSKK
ncbi:MAG: hypothetical protein HKN00_14255 [Flavobacteriaceae bacterium]|nr:peptidyl-prolyl cis-trans isomerase [Bacteroidia bacterium]MBT8287033.1 peptidyl-prolyl cis-trans isomerase [Bacteroidia bacterium]NNF76344.1 hypothetical protein [Flavobacteriaceae bacterium]NNK72754.1 hypothetical protein [Flavobacteriaceae bacterium]